MSYNYDDNDYSSDATYINDDSEDDENESCDSSEEEESNYSMMSRECSVTREVTPCSLNGDERGREESYSVSLKQTVFLRERTTTPLRHSSPCPERSRRLRPLTPLRHVSPHPERSPARCSMTPRSHPSPVPEMSPARQSMTPLRQATPRRSNIGGLYNNAYIVIY